jgi:hypothetical protein
MANQRPGELRCLKCGVWKPDDEFGRERRQTRRGRRSWCPEYETATRREHRRAHPGQERETFIRRTARKGKQVIQWVVMRKNDDGPWEERARVGATSRRQAVEHGGFRGPMDCGE